MGGGAAWLAGRAIAADVAAVVAGRRSTCCILGAAVRFIHFALFESTFLSLHYYLVDFAVCLAVRLRLASG